MNHDYNVFILDKGHEDWIKFSSYMLQGIKPVSLGN